MTNSRFSILKQRFDEGELNVGEHLPYTIKESWLRCRNNSLNMKGNLEYDRLKQSSFDEVKYSSRLLIDNSKNHLKFLHNSVADSGCSILLTDTSCNTLQVMRSNKIVNDKLFLGFEKGIALNEDSVGTTAMSCSIHSKQFARVIGSEHYKDLLVGLNCAALPIFSPQGIVMGSINVTNEKPLDDPSVFFMLKMCAKNIQNQLVFSIPNTIIIELTLSPGHFGELTNLIIAVAPDTTIVGCNEPAQRFLFNNSMTTEQKFHSVFDTSFSEVLNLGIANQKAFLLRMVSGILLTARVIQQPNQHITNPPVQLVNIDTEEKDDAIYFGDPTINKHINCGSKVISRLPIILLGESGVGKEVAAQHLHDESQCSGKFVSINCASIPEALIESELFGYQSGAFTGADKKGHIGRIVEAHKGTLFLDEIGDMPLVMQSRLLRVLETRKVNPLGSTTEKDVQFQLICATNVNLEELVENGGFRKDLYYRIKGYSINLLPLRSRSDKVGIAEVILNQCCLNKSKLSDDTKLLIDNYDWPGNIRELKNALLYVDTMNEGDETVKLEELPEEYHSIVNDVSSELLNSSDKKPQGKVDIEMDKLITAALEQCNGNISEAAKWLGISRATLYRKFPKK